jgi:Cdc6-like AAA superfamily ATPase
MYELREILMSMSTQEKIVFLCVIYETRKDEAITTLDVYSVYRDLCVGLGSVLVTQSMVIDVVSRLERLGLVQTRVVYFGKAATREIKLSERVKVRL